jgi:hypothetical protein
MHDGRPECPPRGRSIRLDLGRRQRNTPRALGATEATVRVLSPGWIHRLRRTPNGIIVASGIAADERGALDVADGVGGRIRVLIPADASFARSAAVPRLASKIVT